MFNGRDISRIVKNPRAAISLHMGDFATVNRIVQSGRREDKMEDAIRLLQQMRVPQPWLRQYQRLRHLQQTLKDTHGSHPLYRRAQDLLDELVRT